MPGRQPADPPPFLPIIDPPSDATTAPGWWFFVRGSELLVLEDGDRAAFPLLVDPGELGLSVTSALHLGLLGEHSCWSAELAPEQDVPSGATFVPLRPLYPRLPERLWVLA